MKKYLGVVLLPLMLGACSTTSQVAIKHKNTMHDVGFAIKLEARQEQLLIAVAENAAPGTTDSVVFDTLPSLRVFASNSYGNTIIIYLPNDLSRYTEAEIVWGVGHELGHVDEDVRSLKDPYEKELTCDQWGLLTVLDLGYDGYKAAAIFDRPEWHANDGITHPNSELRKRRMIETIKLRGNKGEK